MSYEGQLARGMKWYAMRNVEGALPVGVSSDPEKQKDVDAYLEFIEGKDKKKVELILNALKKCHDRKIKFGLRKELEELNSEKVKKGGK